MWRCHHGVLAYPLVFLKQRASTGLYDATVKAGCQHPLGCYRQGGRPVGIPIPLNTTTAPSLVELHPKTFHGRGLIPWGANNFWVITPNVFSPTKWCLRKLTQTETLYARDVSHELVTSHLNFKDLTALTADCTYIPGKVCLVFLDSLLQLTSGKLMKPGGTAA